MANSNTASVFCKKFFRRITKDFQYKQLLPLKLLFFVNASTIFVLYPYLTIHMRELGISVEETAIMSAVTPVVTIVMPPLAGMVADKIGNFKILLSVFSALGGLSALLLLLVPVGRITVTYPDRLIMDVGCTEGFANTLNATQHILSFNIIETEPCDYLDNSLRHVETRLEACGFACQPSEHQDQEELQRVLSARGYSIELSNVKSGNDTVTSYDYSLTIDDMPSEISHDDMRNHREITNHEHYGTSIRNLTDRLFFFPTTGLYNLKCNIVDMNATEKRLQCDFGMDEEVKDGVTSMSSRTMIKSELSLVNSSRYDKSGREYLAPSIGYWVESSNGHKLSNDSSYMKAECTNKYKQNGQSVIVNVPLRNPENNLEIEKTLRMGQCEPKCLVTFPRKQMCSNSQARREFNPSLTFWSYLSIRVFIGVIGGTAFAMFEGAVIAILREHNADYGLQRIYATIGGMISSPLSGLLIDWFSEGKGYTDFRPAFYLYSVLKISSALLMLTINLEFKAPATNVVNDVLAVLKNMEIVALFVAIFVLGTAWGFLESFLFWLLQDLGGSRSLMGITITVGGIAGIPLLVLSGPIISRIGHANVLFIGFIFYAIRLTGYSLIYNPWLCLIFEAMESVTSSLSFTAAVTYAAKLSTVTTDTSIQGLLGGLYYGVGKGAGSLVGGYSMKGFGVRPTYRMFAVMCVIVGTIYYLFNKFFLIRRPMRQGNDIVKKKPKNVENTVEINLDNEKTEKPNGIVLNGRDLMNETLPINKNDGKSYGIATDELKTSSENSTNVSKSPDVKNNSTTPELNASNEEGSCQVNLGYVDDSDQLKCTEVTTSDDRVAASSEIGDKEH